MRLSREVEALIAYVDSTGIPYRVTSTTGGRHAPRSYHFRAGTDGDGLAADFAGPTPGDRETMLAIFKALLTRYYQLHELIFWLPGETTTLVKRRTKRVPTYFGTDVLDAHRNHVHVSVALGTFLEPLHKEVAAMADELAKITGPVELHIIVSDAGDVKGYYFFSPTTGELHSFGDVPFFGRAEAVAKA